MSALSMSVIFEAAPPKMDRITRITWKRPAQFGGCWQFDH